MDLHLTKLIKFLVVLFVDYAICVLLQVIDKVQEETKSRGGTTLTSNLSGSVI